MLSLKSYLSFTFLLSLVFALSPRGFTLSSFCFSSPSKHFKMIRHPKIQWGLWLVSCPAVFSVVTQTAGEGTQRTAAKETKLWWMKSSSVFVLPQRFIFYFILFCCCYSPSKTSHAELNFNDCYQSSTDKIAFFFFIFFM